LDYTLFIGGRPSPAKIHFLSSGRGNTGRRLEQGSRTIDKISDLSFWFLVLRKKNGGRASNERPP
jgi:hypothetical protein